MYRSIKLVLHNLLPKKLLFRIEPYLRYLFSINKRGQNHKCSVCNFESKEWIVIENNDKLCPKCGSLSRDRRLWKLISENYLSQPITVLDFSPSRCLYRKWKKQNHTTHIASDLSSNFMANVSYDITKINEKEDRFDLIICYHILEHVIEDVKAMQELYRVLKPNGSIIIQTPYKEGEIYEDYSITKEEERLIHFGQEDHVRFYSVNGLKKRLESVGFTILVNQYKKDDYLGFSNEIILLATK